MAGGLQKGRLLKNVLDREKLNGQGLIERGSSLGSWEGTRAQGCTPQHPSPPSRSQPGVAALGKEQGSCWGSFFHLDLMDSSWKVNFAFLCL